MPTEPFGGPTWNIVQDLREIFAYGFMQNAFLAGTIVAIVAGVIGYFVVLRRLAFAAEGLSHGGFAGATGAVLINQDVFLGLLVFTTFAGILMGWLGDKLRGRDVAIGATLAFSLALGSGSSVGRGMNSSIQLRIISGTPFFNFTVTLFALIRCCPSSTTAFPSASKMDVLCKSNRSCY